MRFKRARTLNGRSLVACCSLALMALSAPAIAQEQSVDEAAQETGEEQPLRHHRLALFVGYTWVPQGEILGEAPNVVIVPTLGIDYEFWITHRVAVGLVNDFELSSYVVERSDGSLLEREFQYVGAIVGVVEAWRTLSLYAGPGIEADKHETLFLVKVGAEYEFPLRNNWDISIPLSFDITKDYFSVSTGLVIGKRL